MSYASVEELAQVLRIRVTPENTDALQRALDAAADEIDQWLDRDDPLPDPAPAGVVSANLTMAVDVWKSADAAFGVIGSDVTGAVRVSSNSVARHQGLLMPWKQKWGIA
jgi:hypothetical protein